MRNSQIGLLIVTPLILAVAARLYYVGALRLGGMIAAGAAAIAIATLLFFSHRRGVNTAIRASGASRRLVGNPTLRIE